MNINLVQKISTEIGNLPQSSSCDSVAQWVRPSAIEEHADRRIESYTFLNCQFIRTLTNSLKLITAVLI